jgi:hypothetical protein
VRSKNLTQSSRVQLNSIRCTFLVDAGSHDVGSWQIVGSREIPMGSEIREAANILDPPRIPWCEFLIVALHLWISFCLVGLTEICRSAKSGGDKSVEKNMFVSDINKNYILYFTEGPKYVGQATVGESESIPRLSLMFLIDSTEDVLVHWRELPRIPNAKVPPLK